MDWEDQKPILGELEELEELSSGGSDADIVHPKFGGLLWQICPLDRTHYARKKDLDEHVEECKRMCLKSPRKVECPFNPLHIINLMEVEHHIMTCENRVTILNSLHDFEPKRETIEGVLMAPVNVMPVIPTYWEDDEHPDAGYDPEDNTKFRTIIRPKPPGMSKSQKKAWKAKERQRWKWLAGETKEKPRASPYPKPEDLRAGKPAAKTEAEIKEEGTMMQSIIDGLTGANIADPRDAMLKRINARLKVLQMMEAKLKEEKRELQRQVEQYLASIAAKDEKPVAVNADPRLAPKTPPVNSDPRTTSADHTSRILPDIMTSAMIR